MEWIENIKWEKKTFKRIFGSEETNTRNNFLWNTIGTGMLAAATMLFTVIVAQLLGEKAGGLFSFALAIGQWIGTIAYFEIRTFQVTDVARTYGYSDYFFAKIICCTAAVLAGGIYILFQGNTAEKCMILALLCIYKILDGYSDVQEGELQRYGRIDIAGKLLFWRVAGGIIVLTGMILLTDDLMIAVIT